MDGYQETLTFFEDCQRSKSAPRMKNLRPIWTMRICSSSMILRKCLTENPASSAALGMSRNVLFTVHPAVDFIRAPPFLGEHLHLTCQSFSGKFSVVYLYLRILSFNFGDTGA